MYKIYKLNNQRLSNSVLTVKIHLLNIQLFPITMRFIPIMECDLQEVCKYNVNSFTSGEIQFFKLLTYCIYQYLMVFWLCNIHSTGAKKVDLMCFLIIKNNHKEGQRTLLEVMGIFLAQFMVMVSWVYVYKKHTQLYRVKDFKS